MAIAIFMIAAGLFVFCDCIVKQSDRDKAREDEEQERYLAEHSKKGSMYGKSKKGI